MSDFDDSFEELFRRFGFTPGPDGHFDLNSVLASMQGMLNQFGVTDPGLSWARIKDSARTVCHQQGPDPVPSPQDRQALTEAASLADLWLDPVIPFERLTTSAATWSRAEWIENTIPVWESLVSPVATSLSESAVSLFDDQDGDAEVSALIRPMFQPTITMMLAAQIGQALGELPKNLLSATEYGLPLVTPARCVLMPHAIGEATQGLDLKAGDLHIFLALRETARQRLFAQVGWLGPQMLALVSHYARDLRLDTDAIQQRLSEQMSNVEQLAHDPSAFAKSSQELAGTLFKPAVTEAQRQIQDRLETILALVEGWVDDAVGLAMRDWMPHAAGPLQELIRRRRASAGSGQAALTRLIGLELRPRRVRDAANLWAALRQEQGPEVYLKLWSHPDFLPTAVDLDDPLGYSERHLASRETDEMDEELAKLLGND